MPNSGGNAAIFGFLFQAGAAMVLMVENIEQLKKIKFDGEHEDIEIELQDNKRIFAQVKSAMKPAEKQNVLSKLSAALESLSKSDNATHPECLGYMTNILNPIQEIDSQAMLMDNQNVNFLELPVRAQDIIKNHLPKDIAPLDCNKLFIRKINFFSDDDKTRFKVVVDCIEELLTKCRFNQRGSGNELKNIWLDILFQNGANVNLNKVIKKEDIIWPIIVIALDFDRDYLVRIFREWDDAEIEQLYNEYRDIISASTERFLFMSKIISAYTSFQKSGHHEIREFVDENWMQYMEDLDTETINVETREKLIKLIMTLVLYKRLKIDDIKRGVNI